MRHYQRLTGGSAHSSAIAESGTAIASVGALHTFAQRAPTMPPLTRPPIPAAQPHAARAYHRQATDYLALLGDDTDENNS
jgi:hypothetical protein